MSPALQKLSIKEKIGYSLGDTASNLFFLTFLIYMPKFYTDVFGISASAVAVMFLVSKIWDAVNDPMMGMIADRTNTRWGKYRPYLLWFAIPLGVAGILTFSTPNLAGNGKLIYAYVTYTSLMMLYTVINVPYSALMGVMTSSTTDRTSISSFRFVAAFVGQFTAQYAVGILVMKLGGGNDAKGYQLTMSVLSGLAVVLLFITFATTKERVQPVKVQRNPLGQDPQLGLQVSGNVLPVVGNCGYHCWGGPDQMDEPNHWQGQKLLRFPGTRSGGHRGVLFSRVEPIGFGVRAQSDQRVFHGTGIGSPVGHVY